MTKSMENVEDIYALSPLQHGIFFQALCEPKSGMYFNQMSCTLSGKLDLPAFQLAWQQVVDRHPILRTAFLWEGLDEPLQVVRRRAPLPFQIRDWREMSPDEQRTRLTEFLVEDRERGFNLGRAPLLRIALHQVDANKRQFIWSWHHLLLDGWSLPPLLKEVFAYYTAFCKGERLDLPRPHPYRNYIAWLQRQDLRQAEAFWRRRLKGFRAPTPLVARNAGERSFERGYGEERVQLPMAGAASLQSFIRRHQLTLNTLILGAWALLLGHNSGERDVVVGTVVSGRPAELEGVESMLGLFINTLPARVRISAESDLTVWLNQIQQEQSEARQYEYSPLVEVQGWSEVTRGVALFESLLVFENYPVEESHAQESGESVEIHDTWAFAKTNYPITLTVLPGQELTLRIGYDCAHFDAADVKLLLNRLQFILSKIADQPLVKVGTVEAWLREDGERQRLKQERELGQARLQKFRTAGRESIRRPEAIRLQQAGTEEG